MHATYTRLDSSDIRAHVRTDSRSAPRSCLDVRHRAEDPTRVTAQSDTPRCWQVCAVFALLSVRISSHPIGLFIIHVHFPRATSLFPLSTTRLNSSLPLTKKAAASTLCTTHKHTASTSSRDLCHDIIIVLLLPVLSLTCSLLRPSTTLTESRSPHVQTLSKAGRRPAVSTAAPSPTPSSMKPCVCVLAKWAKSCVRRWNLPSSTGLSRRLCKHRKR